jgi:hypothetical protein
MRITGILILFENCAAWLIIKKLAAGVGVRSDCDRGRGLQQC